MKKGIIIVLIASLYFNYKLVIKNEALNFELKSCQKTVNSCTVTYNKTMEEYNASQIRASDTIQKLQKTITDKSFEDCLTMRIPDAYLRVYRRKGDSDKTRKTDK